MDPRLALSWDSYEKNICRGLSFLQQRGEFVDMTLAADGHYVKVHQMVMSLVSPYIKELITATNCPHPVIFLNRISYQTLKAVLEYAYTGEVLVARESLYEFMEACKVLHIKGLEDDSIKLKADGALLSLIRDSDDNSPATVGRADRVDASGALKRKPTETVEQLLQSTEDFTMEESHIGDDALDDCEVEMLDSERDDTYERAKQKQIKAGSVVQYSLSCQGRIQVILNRYIYRLRHARKNDERMYRCAEYNKKGCPAYVVVKGDVVLERGCAHDHPFHDRQILKRVQAGNVYTKFNAAATVASLNRKNIPADKGKEDDSEGD